MDDQKVSVARVEDISAGESLLVSAYGQEVALFNVQGCIYAIGNRCPHRSGPLSRGRVEMVSDAGLPLPEGQRSGTIAVRCPIHGWLFDLSTGRSVTRTNASTPIFPVTCEMGQIYVGPAQGEFAGPSANQICSQEGFVV